MSTTNTNANPPTNTNNSNSTSSKPVKIVLKRVLEMNDSLKLHLYGTQLILEAGLMLNMLSNINTFQIILAPNQ